MDQWSYDAAGDVIHDGTNLYEYDAEGHQTGTLNSLTGLTGYVYDAEGRRVEKIVVNGFGGPNPTTTVEDAYLLGLNGEQVSVLDGSNNWKWTNVYAGGKQLATYDSAGTHFPLTDWLGSKRVELSVTGASTVSSTEQCLSLPYGDGLDCNGTDVNQLHYTGKQRDTESGNDYFGARYYAGNIAGRFLTPDWSKNPQGVPYATFSNPQSLNLYTYVGDNPLNGTDPDGHIDCTGDNAKGVGCQSLLTWNASHGISPAELQKKNGLQQQNAGASPSSGGTSRMVTLDIGGTKVTVAYSYGKIFSNYGGGVDITATPQNCSGCAWAQVYSRGSGAKKDGDGIGPLYGDEGSGLSVFYDTPASSSAGRFTATTILGPTDISGKSFTAIGGFTYGYSINANGGVTMMAPSVATRQQMSGAIQVLQNNSPDWTIH